MVDSCGSGGGRKRRGWLYSRAGNQSQQMSFPWTSGQNRVGRFGEGPGMPSDPFRVSEGAKPARKG